jgi:hypothetical protein
MREIPVVSELDWFCCMVDDLLRHQVPRISDGRHIQVDAPEFHRAFSPTPFNKLVSCRDAALRNRRYLGHKRSGEVSAAVRDIASTLPL